MANVVAFRGVTQGGRPLVPYYLTDRETRRHGVDVGAALATGLMTAEDFTALLSACRACRHGPDLNPDATEDRCAPSAPANCANREILEGLRGIV
ncbi:MAG TPA: DUF6455 family protein [Albidovulum sp.]|uniref:DUF6455 family protein n=1 Tax=Albidovulum sp. TaxID=1872424 RepID=UPI002CCEDE64|nr:DUF6455 family protein [Albidovulum sp.]